MSENISDAIRSFYEENHWYASKQDIAETFGVSVGTVAQALRYVSAEDAMAPQEPEAYKRQVSVREKESIPSTEGLAVILPGRFDDGYCSEVEELIAVGFDRSQIIGIENEQDVYLDMFENGCDIELIYGEALDVLPRLSEISYVHLDYCGMLRPERVATIRALRGRLMPTSRVRVTAYQLRRSPLQVDYEQAIASTFIAELAKHVAVPESLEYHFNTAVGIVPSIFGCISALCPPATMEWFEYVNYGAMVTAWTDLVPGDNPYESMLEQAQSLSQ